MTTHNNTQHTTMTHKTIPPYALLQSDYKVVMRNAIEYIDIKDFWMIDKVTGDTL